MGDKIYNEEHVVISRLIDRQYNNPLGDSAFPLLKRLVGDSRNPIRVLDVGCGRGRTSLWWAQHGAEVAAFDPSEEMLREARRLVEEAGLAKSVTFSCSDIEGFRDSRLFDLIIVHDVLCYSSNNARDLDIILKHCSPRAVLSITSYFGDSAITSVQQIVESWGICPPMSFSQHTSLFSSVGGQVLFVSDTTRQYCGHWADIRNRILMHEPAIIQQVGRSAVERFKRQIDSIEHAVRDRHFGHLWAVIETSPAVGPS